jgi:hypothetical protein
LYTTIGNPNKVVYKPGNNPSSIKSSNKLTFEVEFEILANKNELTQAEIKTINRKK